MSELVNYVHWVVYVMSIVSFPLLLTRWRVYAAVWIAVLFLIQTVFQGCPLTDLYNYFRAQERLSPDTNHLLTSALSNSPLVQTIVSAAIFLLALAVIALG